MLEDKRTIEIEATPDVVFDYIATMPNKFPTFGFFDTRPFLFLRLALVDGLSTAKRIYTDENVRKTLAHTKAEPLTIGASIGPFHLTQVKEPERYFFTLRSFFFNCVTGYSLQAKNHGTILSMDTIAEEPTFREKLYWFLVKPMHIVLANRVLVNIKRGVEGK